MATTNRRVPALVTSTLLVLGVALTVLGVVLMEARQSLLTPGGLSSRAGAALADPRVSACVADRATNAVLAAQPDLTAFRPVVGAVAAATALLAWGAITLMRPAPPAVVQAVGVCNGAAALCDRPLNQVTFAGAHNAMSAADVPGWMFPQHERGVAAQLTDGVRAFLVDVHYGRPAGTSVVTDLDAETASRAKIDEAVGPEGAVADAAHHDRHA
jgi:hypothetical protein